MSNKNKILFNIMKLSVALLIGGFLGVKLLIKGNPLLILLFFVLCLIGGIVLSKININ